VDSDYLRDGTAAAFYRGRMPFVARSLANCPASDVVSFVASVTGKASDFTLGELVRLLQAEEARQRHPIRLSRRNQEVLADARDACRDMASAVRESAEAGRALNLPFIAQRLRRLARLFQALLDLAGAPNPTGGAAVDGPAGGR
jgi:hypothetical protein